MRKHLLLSFFLFCLMAVQGFSQSLPVIQSMSPGGSGASVTYSVTAAFTSPSNAKQVWLKFGDIAGGCNVLWQFTTNAVFLLSSDASTWGPGAQMGSGGTQSNPQCNFTNASAGYTFSGNSVAAHVTLNFLPAFAGPRAISAQAYSVDGTTSAWASASSPWTVPGNSGPPVVNSVYAGSESSQITRTFTIFGTDPAGSSNVMYQLIQFGGTVNGFNLLFEPNLNRVSLLNDAGTSWGTPLTLGTSGVLENSQGSIQLSTAGKTLFTNGASSFATITFKPAFAGARPMAGIMYGYNGLNSGWYNAGTWSIPYGEDKNMVIAREFEVAPEPGEVIMSKVKLKLTGEAPDSLKVYHFNDPIQVQIRFAKPNTQVWAIEHPVEEFLTSSSSCPEYDGGVVAKDGACLLGTTNASGAFDFNSTIKPFTNTRAIHFYVGANTPNATDPHITVPVNEDGYIGAVSYWVVGLNGLPTPPVW